MAAVKRELHPKPLSVWRVIVMFWLLVCLFVPAEGEFVKFLGIARTLGEGTTKVTFSTAQEGYAELETVRDSVTDSLSRSNPVVGLSSWNAVEQLMYYVSAEDGLASAYVTPYDAVMRTSRLQRAAQTTSQTSFTLSSLHFNRFDGKLYGIITFSSGEHFLTSVRIDTSTQGMQNQYEISLKFFLQLTVDSVAPALSALDANKQVYYVVTVKASSGVLVALSIADASVVWEKMLATSVVTSLQLDDNSGVLYGMILNGTGHFLVELDLQDAHLQSFASEVSQNYKKQQFLALYSINSAAEMALSITAFSPAPSPGLESSYHAFALQAHPVFNSTLRRGKMVMESFSLGDARGVLQQSPKVAMSGMMVAGAATLIALQATFSKIPSVNQLKRSTAHVQGGYLVTAYGSPFVDTAELMRCRFTEVDASGILTMQEHQSPLVSFLPGANAVVCTTPSLSRRTRALLDISLNGGSQYTVNRLAFTFFDITFRTPLVGTSKGGTLIQLDGLFLRDLATHSVQYLDSIGRVKFADGVLPDTACEFLPSMIGSIVQAHPPIGPRFSDYSCREEMNGAEVDEVCTISCLSPAIPHFQCDSSSTLPCSEFFTDIASCPSEAGTITGSCIQLIPNYFVIDFALNFDGQRVAIPGGFAFLEGVAPIVTGAIIASDLTAMRIEFDVDTNMGGTNLQADSSSILLDALKEFGRGSSVNWILGNRLNIFFGQYASLSVEAFLEIRPFSISLHNDGYQFVAGNFGIESFTMDQMVRPFVQIFSPENANACTGLDLKLGLSNGGGGRPLIFGWGLRVGKCVDILCSNRVFNHENSSLFSLLIQKRLFTHESSSSLSAVNVLARVGVGLHFSSASEFMWLSQGRNFLYRSHVSSGAQENCLFFGTQTEDCNACFRWNSFQCPGLSHLAVRKVVLNFRPAFSAQIESGHSFVHPRENLSLKARLFPPVLPQDSTLHDDACTLSTPVPVPSSLQESDDDIFMEWSLYELTQESTEFQESLGKDVVSTAPRAFPLLLNKVDLRAANIHLKGSAVMIPHSLLQDEHYYFILFSIHLPGSLQSGTSTAVFRVRPLELEHSLSLVNIASGDVFKSNDNTLLTFSGKVDEMWEIVVSPTLTSNVPLDSSMEYAWSCVAVQPNSICTREWPIGKQCPTSYAYWAEDNIFTRIDDSRTLLCAFAQQDVRTSSPALNFSSEGLEDGFTYRFNVVAVLTSPRKDVGARVHQLATGITALREDGLIRLESGMPIPVMLSVNSRNTKKILPDYDMILSGDILAHEFASGFQGTNGVCYGAGIGCEYLWSELGNSIFKEEGIDNIFTQSVDGFIGEKLSSSFRLPSPLVVSGKRFIFELSIWENRVPFMRRGFQQLVLEVNKRPRNGHVSIYPSTGAAFSTVFTLDSAMWEDDPEDLPLSFGYNFQLDGSQNVPEMVDVMKMVPSATVRIPLSSQFATRRFCNATEIKGCSIFLLTALIQDSWGAVANDSTSILITIEQGSFNHALMESTISRMQGRALIEKDFGGFLLDFGLSSILTNESDIIRSVDEAAKESGTIANTMTFYRTTMIDTLIQFSFHDGGMLIPPTADAAQMLMMSVIRAGELMDDLSEGQVENMLSIVQKVANDFSATRSTFTSPSLMTTRTILNAGSSLVVKRLSSLSLRQELGTTTPLQAGRRLLHSAADSSILSLRVQADDILKSSCISSIGTTFVNGPTAKIETESWSVTIATIRGRPSVYNFTLLSDASSRCGPIETSIIDFDFPRDFQVCSVVFHYNPVNLSNQRSSDGVNDGKSPEQDGVPWPLDTTACPLSVMMFGTDDFERVLLPSAKIAVRFEIGRFGASLISPLQPSRNPHVFLDRHYLATCQYWDDSMLSWRRQHSQTNVDQNGSVNNCHAQRASPTSTSATGRIDCVFDRSLMDFSVSNQSQIFAPVPELADCSGTLDTFSVTSTPFSAYGQFAWLKAQMSQRQVCDRCEVCGGLNQCSLYCDSSLESRKELDLCGVCGGYCVPPTCTVQDCTPLYMRFLGNNFPSNHDIHGDGLTIGRLYQDGPCILDVPAGSPMGSCENTPRSTRIERYPYQDDLKECWEASDNIPLDSKDATCQFHAKSIALDSLDQSLIFTMSVSALDQNFQIAPGDRLGTRGDTRSNGSNPLVGIKGTFQEIGAAIDQLIYYPSKGLNSGTSLKTFRFLRFEVDEAPLKLDVRVLLKPSNDPPTIFLLDKYDVYEDVVSTLNPAIRLLDDANDVDGSFVQVIVLAQGSGGIRFDGREFSQSVSASGHFAYIYTLVRNLHFVSDENMNSMQRGLDAVVIQMTDNGFGGMAPYDAPYRRSWSFNVTVFDQNDSPAIRTSRNVILFQNEDLAVLGNHVTDMDLKQYENSSRTAEQIFEGMVNADQGKATVSFLNAGCNVSFPAPAKIGVRNAKYAEILLPTTDTGNAGSTFLKIDARLDSVKIVYLTLDAMSFLDNEYHHHSLKFSLSIWKVDCFDASAFSMLSAEIIKEEDPSGNCAFFGEVVAFSISCSGARQASLTWSIHQDNYNGVELGRGPLSMTRNEWISIPLESERILQSLAETAGVLCMTLQSESMNGTIRLQGSGKSSTALNANEINLEPRIEIFRGVPFQQTSTQSTCFISVLRGSGFLDETCHFDAQEPSMNLLFYSVGLQVSTSWSNILSNAGAQIVLSVLDVRSQTDCRRDESRAEGEGCESAIFDKSSLKVMPLKKERIGFLMQPFYSESWLATMSVRGEVPLYVALEDCGNRNGIECPTKMLVLPESVPGEYMYGRFTVELSSRLGTVSVPSNFRNKLEFSKGNGVTNSVLRFSGFTVDIRAALMNMLYLTLQDDNLQFKNQFSSFYNASNNPCSRPCFLQDIGKRVFAGADEVSGCQQSCSKYIFTRTNSFLSNPDLEEAGIFLDDIVITFTDNGVTGVGLRKFTSVLLYNLYTIAVNDKPCVVFQDKVSSGCRERCATMGQSADCYDAGLPFDLQASMNVTMKEGQSEAVLLGGLVSKIIDEFESINRKCFFELNDVLVQRSDSAISPAWMLECPRFNVRLAARFGEMALNSREFIEIFLGQGQRFATTLAFLGFTRDSNAATRMLRYRIAENQRNFNSNLGTEMISFIVSDQGFSGSDESGETDGFNQESVISMEVFVTPINNAPIIDVPRAEDPIQPLQNQGSQLSRLALDPGLAVADGDSDECNGDIMLRLSVSYGLLSIATVAEPGVEALAPSVVDLVQFYADSSCQDGDCSSRRNLNDCNILNQCDFDVRANKCKCKMAKPGNMCNSLKMRGPQQDIASALKAVVYEPYTNTNYLSHVTSSLEGEVLRVEVSDHRDPENALNEGVFCGNMPQLMSAWQTAKAYIQTIPVNQPCTSSFDPVVRNTGFEQPLICQGLFDCLQNQIRCGGVRPAGSVPHFGWEVNGSVGISHRGWVGDIDSFEGFQHLYLAPRSIVQPASIEQEAFNFAVGASYVISVRAAARTTPSFGAALEIRLIDQSPEHWSDWAPPLPSIMMEDILPTAGQQFVLLELAPFYAYTPSLRIKIMSFLPPAALQQQERIVFVDDLRITCQKYNTLEDQALPLSSLAVFDPDNTDGVSQLLGNQGLSFTVRLQLWAKYGVFKLMLDDCSIMPPLQLLSDSERVSWGMHCASFFRDNLISEWANTSSFRPPCPQGWTGDGSSEFPCVRLKLSTLSIRWGAFNARTLPAGQQQIPFRSIGMEGTPDEINKVLQKLIQYIPDLDYNTVNHEKESVHVTTNDLGFFNGKAEERETILDMFIESVNDSPNLIQAESFLIVLENEEIHVTGLNLQDADVDEIFCLYEPCGSGSGVSQLKIGVPNGTISIAEFAGSTDFDSVLMDAFGTFTKNPRVQECLMRLSCISDGGFLTLASTSLNLLCGNLKSHRCPDVLQYCSLTSLAFSDLDVKECRRILADERVDVISMPNLESADIKIMQTFKSLTDQGGSVSLVRPNFIIIVGSLQTIQNDILGQKNILYKPLKYQNGLESITFTLSDQGNVGVGFPCGAPPEVPELLLFKFCKEKAPISVLQKQASLRIFIEPINDPPKFEMLDDDGVARKGSYLVQSVQNVTTRLNVMSVFDPDIGESPGCKLKIDFTARNGGKLFFNHSLAPLLEYIPNPTFSSISGEGSTMDMNVFLRNINYRSDAQFTGLEKIVVDVSDHGCTGITSYPEVVTVHISVVVHRQKMCNFDSCDDCTLQKAEYCGWCPGSCHGSGKCIPAQFRGGAALHLGCPPFCTLGSCFTWNMCGNPPDTLWRNGAAGGPLLFLSLVCMYTINMWARRIHGTAMVYLARIYRHVATTISHYKLSPAAGGNNTQLSLLLLCLAIFLCVTLIDARHFVSSLNTYSLGDAFSFRLVTDACTVAFNPMESGTFQDPVKVRAMITGNETLDGVSFRTDFCADSQFFEIYSRREAVSRYVGYLCDIHIDVPIDPAHTIPALDIVNRGSKVTSISKLEDSSWLNFGANIFSASGTVLDIEVTNVRSRRIVVPFLDAGHILLKNATFLSMAISTTSADVAVTVSNEQDMLLPFNLLYQQTENNVCFMSKDDSKGDDLYQLIDRCEKICSYEVKNSTVTASQTLDACNLSCTSKSTAKLLPYRRDLQPGTSDITVDIESQKGQLYFSAIPLVRIPPYSGRELLDNVFIYDGLDNRQLNFSVDALALLERSFHPGQSSRPAEDFYVLELQGVGKPGGHFVWVSDARYLAISRYYLSLFSLGLMVPIEGSSSLPLRPTFCPPFALEDKSEKISRPSAKTIVVNRRGARHMESQTRKSEDDVRISNVENSAFLRKYYELLFAVLRGRNFPPGSLLGFKPYGESSYIVFGIDMETNFLNTNQVSIYEYPLSFALLVIGTTIPALASIIFSTAVLLKAGEKVTSLRVEKLQQQIAVRTLLDMKRGHDKDFETRYQERTMKELLVRKIYAESTFFYFVDHLFFRADEQKSVQMQMLRTFLHIALSLVTESSILILNFMLRHAHFEYTCPDTLNVSKCIIEKPFYFYIIESIHWFFWAVVALELYGFYGNVQFFRQHLIFRQTFYLTFIGVAIFSTIYLSVVVTWVFLGTLVHPSQFLPYVVGVLSVLTTTLRKFKDLCSAKLRFRVIVGSQCDAFSQLAVKKLPSAVVSLIINREEQVCLERIGLSSASILIRSILLFASQGAAVVVLLFCCHAWTDVQNIYLGLFNTLVVGIIVTAVDSGVNGIGHQRRSDRRNFKVMVANLLSSANSKLFYLKTQAAIGISLAGQHFQRVHLQADMVARLNKMKVTFHQGISRSAESSRWNSRLDKTYYPLASHDAFSHRKDSMIRPRARHHAVQVVDNAGQTYTPFSSRFQPEEDVALKGNVAIIKVKGDVVFIGSETTAHIIARSLFVLQHDVAVMFRRDDS